MPRARLVVAISRLPAQLRAVRKRGGHRDTGRSGCPASSATTALGTGKQMAIESRASAP
jgi:hypothetical protein